MLRRVVIPAAVPIAVPVAAKSSRSKRLWSHICVKTCSWMCAAATRFQAGHNLPLFRAYKAEADSHGMSGTCAHLIRVNSKLAQLQQCLCLYYSRC